MLNLFITVAIGTCLSYSDNTVNGKVYGEHAEVFKIIDKDDRKIATEVIRGEAYEPIRVFWDVAVTDENFTIVECEQ